MYDEITVEELIEMLLKVKNKKQPVVVASSVGRFYTPCESVEENKVRIDGMGQWRNVVIIE